MKKTMIVFGVLLGLGLSGTSFASPDQMLRSCFSSVPPIPNNKGTIGTLFKLTKAFVRGGTRELSRVSGVKVSRKKMKKIGHAIHTTICKKHKKSMSPLQRRKVHVIHKKLVAALPPSLRKQFVFTVLRSHRVNAMMAPGGYGFVFSGLLKKLKNKDELAFILAHEVGHSILEHNRFQVTSKVLGRKLANEVLGKDGESYGKLAGVLSAKLLESVYDQDQEFEADRFAFCLMKLAGFDTKASVTALQKLGTSPNPPPSKDPAALNIAYDILRSHPRLSTRIRFQKTLLKMQK